MSERASPIKKGHFGGRRGRPKIGESVFTVYADPELNPKAPPWMRSLAARFAASNMSMEVLALAVDRDSKAVRDTFYAPNPRSASVLKLVTKGLRLPAIVARALCNKLERRDVAECRRFVVNAINQPQYLGPDIAVHIGHLLEAQPPDVMLAIGRVCILASHGLDDALNEELHEAPRADSARGRVLGIIERILMKHKVPAKDWAFSEARLRSHLWEGWAFYYLLVESMGLSESECRQIMDVIGPKFALGPDPHIAYQPSKYDHDIVKMEYISSDGAPPSMIVRPEFERALQAARTAFWLAYRNEEFDVYRGVKA